VNALDYPIQIERLSEADGGGFVAFAIDLPGCMSDGESQEDAVKNLRDAIVEWIDQARALGRAIPEPTQHEPTQRWALTA